MRIGLNAISFAPGRIGGMETYFRNLLGALLEQDKENEYLLLCDSRHVGEFPVPNDRLQLKTFDFAPKSLGWFARGVCRNLLGTDILTGKLKRLPVDLIHHPFTVLTPPGIGIPSVLTFHDMQHEFYPQFFPAWELRKKRLTYRRSVSEATRIIAISHHVKKCLVDIYQVDPAVVDVVYQGCSPAYRPIMDEGTLVRLRGLHGLDRPFLYYPAATWPHKNHRRLLAAIRLMKDRYGFDGLLVLSGISQQAHGNLLEEIDHLALGETVKVLGYLPYEHLPALYSLATMLVFPSLFEGFGIPLVEAMHCGCPVACANVTSLPEVVGDAGVLFDPSSVEDMAENIWRLWNDDGLRAEFRAKGLERARLFDWAVTARQTVAVYRQASA